MKALHLTYRFGRDVVGGAEHYLYELSRALGRSGVDVDVWSTQTVALPPIGRFGVRWDDTLRPPHDRVDGTEIRRYPTFNAPRALVTLFDRVLTSRWRREERDGALAALTGYDGSYLGLGWYPLETYRALAMRWTAQQADVVIRDRDVSEVFFEAMSPRGVTGRFEVNGHVRGIFGSTTTWKTYRFDAGRAGEGDVIHCRIALDGTERYAPDPRPLGLAVKTIGYVAADRTRSVDLADGHLQIVRREQSRWLGHLRARATARPWLFEALFFLLRAPLSPRMLWNLETRIRTYDVVLAQMTPFSTLNYAVAFGKRHGVPVVLLPHFHTDDDFYHLRHYYHAFRHAAAVLATSEPQRAFFGELGARAHLVGGGGVDPAEFGGRDESGKTFRDRFGLRDIPLIVSVGRKSRAKRYDLLVKAVDVLNEHLPCKLVLIGPDEDARPIRSPNVVYLGRQDRDVVVEAYYAADVFALMSESESFGIVFLESWMARKPVIGNRACSAVAELIADGEDGFLCDDALDCAERMAELILDPRLARRLGERGYEKVMREYTWDAIARNVLSIYTQVTAC